MVSGMKQHIFAGHICIPARGLLHFSRSTLGYASSYTGDKLLQPGLSVLLKHLTGCAPGARVGIFLIP